MGMVTGLFHLVFGKRGGRSGSAAAPPSPPVAPPPPPPPPVAPPPPPVIEAAPEPAPDPGPAPAPNPVAPEVQTPAAVAPPVSDAPSPEEMLSPNFKLSAFLKSDTAERLGLVNTPTLEALANLRVTAARMEKALELLGGNPIKIHSAYRSAELNAAVRGVANSDHMSGYSVDFTCAGFGKPYDIVAKLSGDEAFMADVDQIIHEKGSWVHISFAPRRKKEVLTAYLTQETGKRIHYKAGLHKVDKNAFLAEG